MMICEEHRQTEGTKVYQGQRCPWCERDALLLQLHEEQQRNANNVANADQQVKELERLNGEMLELLRQANELYTGYGLICGPIKDFPKYEGSVHQGEWIGKVRAVVRQSEKRKDECDHCAMQDGKHSDTCCRGFKVHTCYRYK